MTNVPTVPSKAKAKGLGANTLWIVVAVGGAVLAFICIFLIIRMRILGEKLASVCRDNTQRITAEDVVNLINQYERRPAYPSCVRQVAAPPPPPQQPAQQSQRPPQSDTDRDVPSDEAPDSDDDTDEQTVIALPKKKKAKAKIVEVTDTDTATDGDAPSDTEPEPEPKKTKTKKAKTAKKEPSPEPDTATDGDVPSDTHTAVVLDDNDEETGETLVEKKDTASDASGSDSSGHDSTSDESDADTVAVSISQTSGNVIVDDLTNKDDWTTRMQKLAAAQPSQAPPDHTPDYDDSFDVDLADIDDNLDGSVDPADSVEEDNKNMSEFAKRMAQQAAQEQDKYIEETTTQAKKKAKATKAAAKKKTTKAKTKTAKSKGKTSKK